MRARWVMLVAPAAFAVLDEPATVGPSVPDRLVDYMTATVLAQTAP